MEKANHNLQVHFQPYFRLQSFMRYQIIVFILSIACVFTACKQEPLDYEGMIKKGLESGIVEDSLFLGYYFGMPRDDFFEHSWGLNQEGKITGLVKVEYEPDWLPYKSKISFFPDFEDAKVSRMPVEVNYTAWAPWNKERSSDSLMVHLRDYFEKEYDQKFQWMYLPNIQKNGFFSVKGNRAISIYRKDEMIVHFIMKDLRYTE